MKRFVCLMLILGAVLALAGPVAAQDAAGPTPPTLDLDLNRYTQPEQISVVLQILFLLTILSLAPSILVMMTSFTRILVVLGFMRQAMGTQQMPPTQILVGLSIFLTIFIMSPILTEVNDKAIQPYVNEQIGREAALKAAEKPIREFMIKQTREKDLALMIKISGSDRPQNINDVGILTLIPAFIISELKTAFQIGFLLYIPFLVIDMVVASILLSMGMMMLPPIMVSLPFKLMLFVLVDGWYLVIGSIVRSFG